MEQAMPCQSTPLPLSQRCNRIERNCGKTLYFFAMSQSFLQSIIDVIWKQSGNVDVRTLVLLDDGFAEMFKWRNESHLSDIPIMPLVMDKRSEGILSLFQPGRIAIFTSHPLDEVDSTILSIKQQCPTADITILTTTSSDLLSSMDTERFRIQHFIAQSGASLLHLPTHALNILSPNMKQKVGLFILASPACREVFPLTLRSLQVAAKSDATESRSTQPVALPERVRDLAAEHIPPVHRKSLKFLAHELAGSLVYDIGVDPSGSVFAFGKTASLVGHTVQMALSPLVQEWGDPPPIAEGGRALLAHSNWAHLLSPLSSSSPSPGKLSAASLVLIDRTVDLFTPSCHDADGPIAHRILSTIKRQQGRQCAGDRSDHSPKLLDISLPQVSSIFSMSNKTLNGSLERAGCSSVSSDEEILSRPLSAVAALPVAIDPSIAPLPPTGRASSNSSSAADSFLRCMFACSEERGKAELYSQLRERVLAEEKGVLPPAKKRGVGAEVLGLVNALVATSSTASDSEVLPEAHMHRNAVLQSQSLVAWSMAVIDAMQRSSTKQLHAHLQTQGVEQCSIASFEMRNSRERELQATVLQQCHLGILSPSVLVDMIIDLTGLGHETSFEEGERKIPGGPVPRNDSVDLKHTLMLVIGVLSLVDCSYPHDNTAISSAVNSLSRALARYFVNRSSAGQLDFAGSLISAEVRADIASLRSYKSSTEEAHTLLDQVGAGVEWEDWGDDHATESAKTVCMRLTMELEDVLGCWLESINELASLRRQSLPVHPTGTTAGDHALSQGSAPAAGAVEGLSNMVLGLASAVEAGDTGSSKKHKVVKTSELGRPKASGIGYPSGILGATTAALLRERRSAALGRKISLATIGVLDHIENPLFSLARAGLGMLSQGLGRFGLGGAAVTAEPHPSSNPIIVIFVVGGVSLLEVQHIQDELDKACREDPDGVLRECRVIVGSNDIVSPSDIVDHVLPLCS